MPVTCPLPAYYSQSHGKRKREKRSLSRNLVRVRVWKNVSPDVQQYGETLSSLSEQLLVLLNAEPSESHLGLWQYEGFHPYWRDANLIVRYNKRIKKWEAEERRQKRLEEKRMRQESQAALSRQDSPLPETGKGRRPGPVPGVFKGVQFRSQLEIRFATELESRGIRWVYETERLGEGNYLVDFYLPDFKTWVEVKGRFEPRDDYLLRDVATYLKNERQERLFVYTQSKCFAVSPSRFTEIERARFWDRNREPLNRHNDKILCAKISGVFRRGAADDGFEVLDEVRLIEIAQLQRHFGPVAALTAGQPLGRLLQAKALDDPFRADSHILLEEALQAALAQVTQRRKLLHARDLPLGDYLLDDRVDQVDLGVVNRQPGAQERLDHFAHSRVIQPQQIGFQRLTVLMEGVAEGDRAIGKR